MPYGEDALEATLEGVRVLDTLDVAAAPALADVPGAVRAALREPIGPVAPLANIVRAGERVAIVVSDSFRTTRIEQVLPVLLDALQRAGVREEDVSFVFSTGSHRGPTEAEKAVILGEAVYARFKERAFSHDPDDRENLVLVGETSRGTPVEINRRVHEADRVIATGAVVLHYFGGFGGGRKSIVPGLASKRTIAHNHARNLHATEDRLDPAVRIGALDGNPVAEDMLEAASLTPVDFMINTVLNRDGQIAGLFAGHLDQAHRAACDFARTLFAVNIPEQADIVVASAGKAKNFIQSHKALFNAYQAMKPGGRIVFLTQSPEGFGGNKFAQWLALRTPEAIIQALRRDAEINGQTALSTVEKARSALIVTALSEEEVALLGGRKAPDLQTALDWARADLAASGIARPTCYLMPSAAYSVPFHSA
jgi:nickel-dependent lactate racemase